MVICFYVLRVALPFATASFASMRINEPAAISTKVSIIKSHFTSFILRFFLPFYLYFILLILILILLRFDWI